MATGASVSGPVAIEFSTPMNQRSVAAAVSVDPPTSVELAWDAAGDTPDDLADDGLGAGRLPHGLGAGGRPGPDRPADGPAGPRRLPDPRAHDRPDRRDGTGRQACLGRNGVRRHVRRSRRHGHGARRDPPGAGHARNDRGDGCPEGPDQLRVRSVGAAQARYRLQAGRGRRARPGWAGARATVDRRPHREGAGRRPVQAARRRQRHAARRRDLGPFHRADGSPGDGRGVLGVDRRQGHQGDDHLGRIEHGAGLQAGDGPALRGGGRGQGRHHRQERDRCVDGPVGPRDLPYGREAGAASRHAGTAKAAARPAAPQASTGSAVAARSVAAAGPRSRPTTWG